jgi:hypothetical protein
MNYKDTKPYMSAFLSVEIGVTIKKIKVKCFVIPNLKVGCPPKLVSI